MFSVWMSSMGYQKVVEKAKIINAKREQCEEDKATREERESIWEYVDDEYYTLKSELWAGISEWKHAMRTKGISEVVIDERSNTLGGKSVNEYKIDYNGAMKDVRDRTKRKFIRKVKNSLRMGRNTFHRREETIEKISTQMRKYFFDELHKICGVNKDVSEMEQKYAGVEFFTDMTNDILSHAEEVSALRESEIERIKKEYSVKTFNVVQIYRTIFKK